MSKHHEKNSEMEYSEKEIFHRAERLLGSTAMGRIQSAKVIIFGVGGVGSWCAESLVRSGIKHMTIVDPDCVATTNINRQLMATTKTVGKAKVEVLKERLLEISPNAEILPLQTVYSKETMHDFHLEDYDYIIDCIDSLKDKIQLILHATSIERTASTMPDSTDAPAGCSDKRMTTILSSSLPWVLPCASTR